MAERKNWDKVIEKVASDISNKEYDSAAKSVYNYVFNSDYRGAYSPMMADEVYKAVEENAVDENAVDRFQGRWEYHNEMGA